MTRRHLWSCALVCGLAATVWQISFAQAPPAGVARPRPQGQPLRVPALSPELESLLKTWEQQSAGIKTLTGKHIRSEINSVFQVEKRSEGKFFFEAPDKGRIDMVGIPPKRGEQGAPIGPDKTPCRLQEGPSERWICTGQEVLQINEKAKEYEVAPIPRELQGTNIVRSPLPFLFGLKAEEAKRRFQFRLLNETNEYFALEVVPLTNQDAFEKAILKLDKRLFVPTAVILYDRAGGLMQRYDFEDIKVNNPGFTGIVRGLFGQDPFKPNLQAYKLVQPPAAGPPGPADPNAKQPALQPTSGTARPTTSSSIRVQIQQSTTIPGQSKSAPKPR
jgi:TIGR03009 family protein